MEITTLRFKRCPEFQIYSSALIRLEFIKNVLLGKEQDKTRLHKLVIGVWAAKEFEAIDPELAKALGTACYIGIQIVRGLKNPVAQRKATWKPSPHIEYLFWSLPQCLSMTCNAFTAKPGCTLPTPTLGRR